SEPRSAGKAPAVCFSSQRVTSVGDSFLFILACGPLHTHRQEKNCAHKNATSLGFYVLTCVSRQKLARGPGQDRQGGALWPSRRCLADYDYRRWAGGCGQGRG